MPTRPLNTKDGLFGQFEWQVDQHGYEVGHAGPSGSPLTQGVEGKGGPSRAYRLDLEDSHAGLFREFAALKPTQEQILRFANEYGCLVNKDGAVERFTEWYYWIDVMNNLVAALDSGRHEDFWEGFNEESSNEVSWWPNTLAFVTRIEADPVPAKSRFKLVPTSLLAAMWLQLANAGTKSTAFKQCEFCPHWFPVGPGTGRKPSKKFCSNRCRVAWNRAQK
jgi:hypothetical protein